MAQDDSKYSKPELRERIKDRVMAGSKGGKPGQGSRRRLQGRQGWETEVSGEVGQGEVDD
jgi:hypothetical protein